MCTGMEIMMLAGTGMQALGGIQQANAQAASIRREGELQAIKAQSEEAQLRKDTQRLLARQRSGFSKSGVAQSGSVLDVMRETAEEAELEALNIQFGATAGSQAREFEAKQVKKASKMQAATTLLTGMGRIG